MADNNDDTHEIQRILRLLDDVHEEYQNEEVPTDFIPEIDCSSANNGILKLSVRNIETLWAFAMFAEPFHKCFKITCKCVLQQKNTSNDTSAETTIANTSTESEWDEKCIFIGNVDDDGTFYLLLPSRLECYDFVFTLQANNLRTQQWMSRSKQYTVRVPSFVIDMQYEVNERVEFRPYGEHHPREAQIMEVLGDNQYRLQYDAFYDDGDNEDDAGDDAGDGDGGGEEEDERKQKEVVVDVSRLYKEEINHQYVTCICSDAQLEYALFIQRNDEYCLAAWHALERFTCTEAAAFCAQMFDCEEILVHVKAMSYFVAKHVYDCLFEPQFELRLHCFIDHNDGALRLQNVRQNAIALHYQEMQQQNAAHNGPPQSDRNAAHKWSCKQNAAHNDEEQDDLYLEIDTFDGTKYACDWCWLTMGEWEFYYTCDAALDCRHDVCMNCVAKVVQLNLELKRVLGGTLDRQLIKPIVDCIADFVIGGVRLVANQNEEEWLSELTDRGEKHGCRDKNENTTNNQPPTKKRKLG